MTHRRRLEFAAGILIVELVLDQLTKAWAESALKSGRVISVLPTIEFDLTYNRGFSFGTGSDRGRLVGYLVVVIVAVLARQIIKETNTTRALLMAVILGGAVGNLIDRVFRADDGFMSGRVIDFVDVSWYAVFNLADTFVVVGAIALVVSEVSHDRHSPPN